MTEKSKQHIVLTESGSKCSHANSYVTKSHPDDLDGDEKPYCRWCKEFIEL